MDHKPQNISSMCISSPIEITGLFKLHYGYSGYLELLLHHYLKNLDTLFEEVHATNK